ncbi:MAG: primosomal protein N' [Bacteroidales bacterium]|nr:primosomal protein N' [Bacteroidales bacterium]
MEVILPLKLSFPVTYSVPDEVGEAVQSGSLVAVTFSHRRYPAVVCKDHCPPPAHVDLSRILPIEKILAPKPLTAQQLAFWQDIASYYLCSVADVFRSACPSAFLKESDKTRSVSKPPKTYVCDDEKPLSEAQQKAYDEIESHYANGLRTVLLDGVTASGKTEIYIKAARRHLDEGRNVLYLVPEIAISRQLEERLRKALGDKVVVYHSKQTVTVRKKIFDRLSEGCSSTMILGTRSALLLPLSNLGFIIVDEEHDSSYKQNEPNPRYNGRDAALMLASRLGICTLLGSATPSMESLYNVSRGKYGLVQLRQKYYGAGESEVTVIDMNEVYRLRNAKGAISQRLINLMGQRLARKEQIMVFRSRRAYSSFIQCDRCGAIARCPKCNVGLTYHKFSNSLSCHYCGYSAPFSSTCADCGKGTYLLKGSGTEKIAEQLQSIFPEARIARFDLETTTSKVAEKQILKEFEDGKIDILVGTQMITKGFDFEKLTLVAVVSVDSILSLQDFRADEKACQLLTQLKGRACRRTSDGEIVIQTSQPQHPIIEAVKTPDSVDALRNEILEQRKQFNFPPYVRLIQIVVKDASQDNLRAVCATLMQRLPANRGLMSPLESVPPIDRIAGKSIRNIWIKLPRRGNLARTKTDILKLVEELREKFPSTDITIDVDPL